MIDLVMDLLLERGYSASMDNLAVTSDALREPLHSRVRQLLRELLQDFDDGRRFYSERDLIKKLKVSQPTVRRALLDLANEGYLTASPRRGFFVRKKTAKKHIGVITPGYTLTGGLTMVEILANVCREKDIEFHTYYLRPEDTIEDALKMIRHKPSDERIILMGLEWRLTRALAEKLQSAGYVHLIVNYVPRGHIGRSVGFDEEAGFKLVLDHLKEFGHKRILIMVTESTELMSTVQRTAIVQKQLKTFPSATIVSCETKNWSSSFDATYLKIREVLKQKSWPTAICPLSGTAAWAVLRYCMEQGIRVPEDVSLVCYDPIPGTELLPVPLTSLSYALTDMAEAAVNLVWADDPKAFRKLIKPELIVRASTGPAPAH